MTWKVEVALYLRATQRRKILPSGNPAPQDFYTGSLETYSIEISALEHV